MYLHFQEIILYFLVQWNLDKDTYVYYDYTNTM